MESHLKSYMESHLKSYLKSYRESYVGTRFLPSIKSYDKSYDDKSYDDKSHNESQLQTHDYNSKTEFQALHHEKAHDPSQYSTHAQH